MEPAPAPSICRQSAREAAAAPASGGAVVPAVLDPAGSMPADPATTALHDSDAAEAVEAAEPLPRDILGPADPGEGWTVLYTRFRCEKKAARACMRLGIRHYLPLRERPRCDQRPGSRHRRRVHKLPLLPSYLFACLGASVREPLLESGAIARVIPVPHPASLLDELRQIRAALAAGADLVVGPALVRGTLVRVASGPLSGVVGRVAWVRRRRVRLVLNVTMLKWGAEVDVDAEVVTAVGALPDGAAPPGCAEEGAEGRAVYGGRRPWRVRRGRVVGDSLVGAV